MAKFTMEEAVNRFEAIAQEYSKSNPENPMGVLSVDGSPFRKALVATSFSYRLMGKIMYVLSRCDHEYWIRSENNNVLIMIVFYK